MRVVVTNIFVNNRYKALEFYTKTLGKDVIFTTKPAERGEVTLAIFDDTCSNLIQMIQI